MKGLGIIAALVVAAAVGWYVWALHGSTFRYRLTVAVESSGKTYTGSGVIQVNMHFQDYWSPPALPRVTGDAVIVDVPGARSGLRLDDGAPQRRLGRGDRL